MSDVVIIGAGAAGLMCAIEAGKRGKSVVVLERNETIGEKIRISGGGRCNFTNRITRHEHYLSGNLHFCKSALARFTPEDFIALVEKHGITYHEKKLGQLFCDQSSRQIISMLERECADAGVNIIVGCHVTKIHKGEKFEVVADHDKFNADSLVIATGGLSIPKLGATDFGYRIAQQFGVKATFTKPGLVPFTFGKEELSFFSELSAVSLDALVSCNTTTFRENILFTHRGLSGPAILQISSYWKDGEIISINLSPDIDILMFLSEQQSDIELATALSEIFPKRLDNLII